MSAMQLIGPDSAKISNFVYTGAPHTSGSHTNNSVYTGHRITVKQNGRAKVVAAGCGDGIDSIPCRTRY